MCDACRKTRYLPNGETVPALNPEPDQVALYRYARLVERQETPRAMPKWLTQHLRANYVKPFKPDYSLPSCWPWSEGFREPPNREPDTPVEFVSLWDR